ncbi:hypothetical protein NO1_0920 [Candidatus Termititenax aidoneus]|uniref:Uncharacterized protein n=1 Tax=Termititenax aidoneus TaxID=2218524 RepID=A0A388TBG9_TERA1|nr:hypothetical protein NO1_0920 [Candidatus Termititenax aidoneus]
MRYLRNIVLISLLLTAFLPAWNNKLVFQGNIRGSDGYGYTGQLSVGVKIFNVSQNGTEMIKTFHVGSANIDNGIYTVELEFTTENMDTLMAQDNIYLEIYLAQGGGVDNSAIFNAKESDNSTLKYRLEPRVHLLGVPMALKVRGVHISPEGNLGIGSYSADNSGGLSVASGYKVSIGKDAANNTYALHVSGNAAGATALQAANISGGTITGDKVYNVKWE